MGALGNDFHRLVFMNANLWIPACRDILASPEAKAVQHSDLRGAGLRVISPWITYMQLRLSSLTSVLVCAAQVVCDRNTSGR